MVSVFRDVRLPCCSFGERYAGLELLVLVGVLDFDMMFPCCQTLFMILALIPAIRGDIDNNEPHPQRTATTFPDVRAAIKGLAVTV